MESFGDRLKAAYATTEIAVLARKMGVTYQAAKNYVTDRLPSPEKLVEISNSTGCSIDWLLTGKGEKHFRPGEREIGGVSERIRVVAGEQSRRMHADAEIDGGGGERATLRLLTDYLLATALVEFKIIDSIRDVMTPTDLERAKRFGFSRPTIDERLRQMMRAEIEGASGRVSDAAHDDKIIATITPGVDKKRRTG